MECLRIFDRLSTDVEFVARLLILVAADCMFQGAPIGGVPSAVVEIDRCLAACALEGLGHVNSSTACSDRDL